MIALRQRVQARRERRIGRIERLQDGEGQPHAIRDREVPVRQHDHPRLPRRSERDVGAEPVGGSRLVDEDVAPRGQGLHAARIIAIDDKSPGPTGAKAYRVDAGRHVLKIGEKIESRYLSFNDRQRNAQIGGGYKTLTVEVAPNTTYLVAARLNEDQRDNPANGAYWDPVVYRESPEACR